MLVAWLPTLPEAPTLDGPGPHGSPKPASDGPWRGLWDALGAACRAAAAGLGGWVGPLAVCFFVFSTRTKCDAAAYTRACTRARVSVCS